VRADVVGGCHDAIGVSLRNPLALAGNSFYQNSLTKNIGESYMVYQTIAKPSSRSSQTQKKDNCETARSISVQTKSVSAPPQEQEMPSYTPLPANWATNNNLMRSMSGNQVVQRQEESGEEEIEPIQAKLTIGEVGDKYEQEADETAQRVVNQINTPTPQQSTQGESLQREEMPEEELQMKSESGIIQREDTSEEEELQMQPEIQRKSDGGGLAATPNLESSIQQAKGSGQPLADNIREPMENAFGADFSSVNVHTDAQSDQLNQSIQAKAFTTGQDIFFRQGAYDPGSRGGQELIAHELTHVVQQSGGAVQRVQLQHETTSHLSLSTPTIQRYIKTETTSATYTKMDGVTSLDAVIGSDQHWVRGTNPNPAEPTRIKNIGPLVGRYVGGHMLNQEWGGLGNYKNMIILSSSANGSHKIADGAIRRLGYYAGLLERNGKVPPHGDGTQFEYGVEEEIRVDAPASDGTHNYPGEIHLPAGFTVTLKPVKRKLNSTDAFTDWIEMSAYAKSYPITNVPPYPAKPVVGAKTRKPKIKKVGKLKKKAKLCSAVELAKIKGINNKMANNFITAFTNHPMSKLIDFYHGLTKMNGLGLQLATLGITTLAVRSLIHAEP
jgi:hypothetical protein